MEDINLTHQFLIAMPGMADPNFSRSLVYICEHNPQGALGVIVNRPIDMDVPTLFGQVQMPPTAGRYADSPVYFGGPVQTDRGFVLHRPLGHWQFTLEVNSEIGLTSSRDILQAMGERGEPGEALVSLGYSGWGAGQIEWELAQNAWLSVAADPEIIFALPPEERLPAAMRRLGVDFTNLSEVAGHA